VIKPDAVFPNNRISTHEDGTVVLYPMLTPNRRAERRMDVVTELENNFQVAKIIDLSNYEASHQFLEGTGSIVFDHTARVAYACLSPRTHLAVLLQLCNEIGYTAISFHAVNEHNVEVYHTNVIIGIGADFAVICLASIPNETERNSVVQSLLQSGKEIIDVSFDQIKSFAGNVLAVNGKNDISYLAMSQSAFESFTKEQLAQIGKYCQILPIPIPTIETIGGGSVRCMLAQNFLKKK
ncbi:MAG: amidinotransferase, partial [Chitinophagaceae bacterium]|nr:amidinotransferase [Chitinophagaceae bacterium]